MNYRPFSSEDDAQLRALWADRSRSVESVALELDRGATSVRKRAAILGLPLRLTANLWSDERKDLCSRLWQEGKSAREIAIELGGVSRNAVIGVIHRMGMSNRPAPARLIRLPKAHRRAKAHVARPRAVAAATEPRTMAEPRQRMTHAPIIVDATLAKPWTERTFGECAYPIAGEGADAVSCCQPCDVRGYCPGHRAVMFVKPPKPAERMATYLAKRAA